MSEEILKALMQLFAIITKQDGGVSQNERDYVVGFLVDTLNEELVAEYLKLYDEYSEYGKELTEEEKQKLTSVKDSVRTLAICKKINKTLSQKQKVIVLIRLFELLKANSNFSEQSVMIVDTVSDVFNISKDEHKTIETFVSLEEPLSESIENVLIIKNFEENENQNNLGLHSHGLDGFIAILHITSVDMYFMTYNGNDEISLNGVTVKPNSINLFAYGSIIKVAKSDPIFYSDAVAHFLSDLKISPISFVASNLEFRFPNGGIGLKDINISENNNKLIAIMGASGAGKTTLLNTLSGLEEPSEGSITINGRDIFTHKDEIEGTIGYISQDDILIEELTVYENLYFSAKLCLDNLSEPEIHKRVEKVLDNLGLWERKDLKVGNVLDKTISGGQRKRLNIALELIREPDVLFVDEPTSGLSSRDSENVIDLLKELSLKGKLIFVVIHQPSSDIYKMFDKVIILDVGGLLIYYGNPVGAVTYFKKAANQLNSESGQCNLCGNVNPEQIFNIIEERVVDDYGNFTDKRKTSPTSWHEKYEDTKKLEQIEDVKDALPQNLHIPSKFKQLFLFTKRDLKAKLSNKQYLLINLLEAPVLAALLAFIIRYIDHPGAQNYIFRENENLPAYIFMSVIVSFFMGLTVSAEEIIRDRKLLKREALLNLSRNSYLLSKISILFTLSAIQALLFVLIGNTILGISGMYLNYWLVFFAVSCFANVLGLNISATFNSAVTIYILIPLLIIPQMVLSGAIFDFDKLNSLISSKEKVPLIADTMVSRWAFEALAVTQFKDNYFEKSFYEIEKIESKANFKQVYYIPKMVDMVHEIIEEEKTNAKKKDKLLKHQIEDHLLIIYNEVTIENFINPKVKFKDVEKINYNDFTPKVAHDLQVYLKDLEKYYKELFNFANTVKDEKLLKYQYSEESKQWFQDKKDQYTNDNFSDIMKNINAKKRIILYDGHLVQKIDPIYLDPVAKGGFLNYRAHFYAPTKRMFNRYFDTFSFNIIVIWIGTLMLYFTLYFESMRWALNKLSGSSVVKKIKNK